MGLICVVVYLGVFLIAPFVIATKAAASEHGLQLRVLFRYLAVYFVGVIAACGITVILAFTLPKPNGPPDQAVGQLMALAFVVFPVLSLVLGATGLAVMTWRIQWRAPRGPVRQRPDPSPKEDDGLDES